MTSILIALLLIVEVVTAFLLIVVILAQKSKDQGLGMAFGSGMGESLFGSRAGNVLTRMTITLAIVFMISTILLGILFARGAGPGRSGSILDQVPEAPMPMEQPVAAPVAGAPVEITGDAPDFTAEGEGVQLSFPTEAAPQPIILQVGEDGQLIQVPADEAGLELEPAAEEPVVVEETVAVVEEVPVAEAAAPAAEEAAPAEDGE